MDLGLAGKVALVGGGSRGIGLAVAKDLAAEAAHVVIAARDRTAIDAAVADITASGGKASGISADMFSEEGVSQAVRHCVTEFGSMPDIAIANVYGTARYSFDEAGNEVFRAGYEQIVMSTVYLARAVLPSMKTKRWGRIVTIGSFCAKKPHWHIPLIVDNVTRAGAVSLSKSLSNEVGRYGITVNTVGPGFIDTEMAVEWMRAMAVEQGKDPDADRATRDATIPIGRNGRPDELSAACVFLCSERASYITGQLLMVDGGLVPSPV
ncbi:SDR family oxidoreductase [Sphingomonas profundi]|uniref:SDR family oxidoreductase n=1 Tax=Alterirhizorhabdus profundi TaxID=2681549 RepID=UPI0012E6F12F|nr:SDR family oxidoreductase [Sphingomonas profundi]